MICNVLLVKYNAGLYSLEHCIKLCLNSITVHWCVLLRKLQTSQQKTLMIACNLTRRPYNTFVIFVDIVVVFVTRHCVNTVKNYILLEQKVILTFNTNKKKGKRILIWLNSCIVIHIFLNVYKICTFCYSVNIL